MTSALGGQNTEEDVEAILKSLGIVVDERVDACLRFKSLGNMQAAMETLSSWAASHPEGKFALRKRSGMTKSRGVCTQRVVCTREGRPNALSGDRSRQRMSQAPDVARRPKAAVMTLSMVCVNTATINLPECQLFAKTLRVL